MTGVSLVNEEAMRTFSGRLWLVRDQHSKVETEVVLDLDEQRLKITSHDVEIGDWSVDEFDVTREGAEIHLTVEGEELVIVSSDIRFAPAVAEVFSPSSKRPQVIESGPQSDDIPSEGNDEKDRNVDRSRRRGAHRRPGSFKLKW